MTPQEQAYLIVASQLYNQAGGGEAGWQAVQNAATREGISAPPSYLASLIQEGGNATSANVLNQALTAPNNPTARAMVAALGTPGVETGRPGWPQPGGGQQPGGGPPPPGGGGGLPPQGVPRFSMPRALQGPGGSIEGLNTISGFENIIGAKLRPGGSVTPAYASTAPLPLGGGMRAADYLTQAFPMRVQESEAAGRSFPSSLNDALGRYLIENTSSSFYDPRTGQNNPVSAGTLPRYELWDIIRDAGGGHRARDLWEGNERPDSFNISRPYEQAIRDLAASYENGLLTVRDPNLLISAALSGRGMTGRASVAQPEGRLRLDEFKGTLYR